jgi:hypothetical protein
MFDCSIYCPYRGVGNTNPLMCSPKPFKWDLAERLVSPDTKSKHPVP